VAVEIRELFEGRHYAHALTFTAWLCTEEMPQVEVALV
jgi:hypothetical protein